MKILVPLTFALLACETRALPASESGPASFQQLSAGMTDGAEEDEAQEPAPVEPSEIEADPLPPMAPDEVASTFRGILRQHGAVSIHDLPLEVAAEVAALMPPSVTPEQPDSRLVAAVAAAYAEFDKEVIANPTLTADEVVALKSSMVGEGVVEATAVNP